jgi:hypothetical protein
VLDSNGFLCAIQVSLRTPDIRRELAAETLQAMQTIQTTPHYLNFPQSADNLVPDDLQRTAVHVDLFPQYLVSHPKKKEISNFNRVSGRQDQKRS